MMDITLFLSFSSATRLPLVYNRIRGTHLQPDSFSPVALGASDGLIEHELAGSNETATTEARKVE